MCERPARNPAAGKQARVQAVTAPTVTPAQAGVQTLAKTLFPDWSPAAVYPERRLRRRTPG